MRELVFALEFRGKARPVLEMEGAREARTTASTEGLVTFSGGEWLRVHMKAAEGESAVLEARVQRYPDGTFVEEGTITYGTAGTLSFETVGRGWVEPSPVSGTMRGAVVWTIVQGTGALTGATGLIASNFVANADGDVVDNHVARLYVTASP